MHDGKDHLPPTAAPWRRRLGAPRLGFPRWARDHPGRLVYGSNESGAWEVYAWDRSTGVRRQVTDRPGGTTLFAIDPGGDRIWWFDDTSGDERGRWMIESFDGSSRTRASRALGPAYHAGLVLARRFALIGTSDDEGTTISLLPSDGAPRPLYRHRRHAMLETLDREERFFAIRHSEDGSAMHMGLRVLDLEGRTRAELPSEPGVALRAGAWSPLAGDYRLLITRDVLGAARPAVWTPLTGAVDGLDIDLPGEVSCLGWYPDARSVLLLHGYRARTELFRYDLHSGACVRLELPRGTVTDARVRTDGALCYEWSDSRTPPGVYRGSRLLLSPEEGPGPDGVPYRDLWLGDLHAFVAEPPGPGPHPTVFLIHGGPIAHHADAFNPRVQAWVDHGFAVALVNYRGSSGYGGAWRDAIIGNPGFGELEDLGAVRDLLVKEGTADPARLLLVGHSWGGYLALLGAGLEPDRWSLAIADAPVADYEAAYADEMDALKMLDNALFGGSPEQLPELYRERSPLTYVERVKVPLLILAAANDPRCPIRQIENYLTRLEELGKPHEVLRLDFGHGAHVTGDVIRKVETQIDFAARHLGTTEPM
ncbi:S9 family peptidase [Actinoallomurus acaciae]|uniref:S9 family peptidase n=1 Tax=Actinoallomurus acaciae TaxID=502577 RepID=A0ABV5YPV6_9ACTN